MVRFLLRAIAFATLASECEARLSGPAPGPSAAPAPGPVPLPPATDVVTNFDKKVRRLPEQGYDERSHKDWVQHQDFDTALGDWQRERPRRQGEVHDGDSTTRACEEHPEYLWCNLYLRDRNKRKRGPKVVHQVVKVYKKAETSSSAGTRAAERAVQRQHETVEREAQEKLQGMDKGFKNTEEQAGETTDQMSAVLPYGMWPSQGQVKRRQEDGTDHAKENGGDFPPGMVSKPGGPSPYDPVSFHAQPAPAHKSLSDMW